MGDPRLDKLLWSLRVFKTRPLATAACRAGRVRIGEREAKPGRDVRAGETLVVHTGEVTRTLKVVAIPRSRISARQLPDFMTDITPAAEYERARQAGLERRQVRQRVGGRPTKRERREISEFFGTEPPES